MDWKDHARADLREVGPRRFWWDWRVSPPELRAAAYARGRFTPRLIRTLDRFVILQAPRGMAWTAASLTVGLTRLLPRWLPGYGALPSTPWTGAVCLNRLNLILGVDRALTPEVVAHEFAHAIFPRLPRRLRREFPRALAELEALHPELTRWLDHALAGYRDPRSPDECHVRLLEWFDYGRVPLPEALWPYYRGWVEGGSAEESAAGSGIT